MVIGIIMNSNIFPSTVPLHTPPKKVLDSILEVYRKRTAETKHYKDDL